MSLISVLDEMVTTLEGAFDADTDLSNAGIHVQVWPFLNMNPTPPSIDIYPGDPAGESDATGFGEQRRASIFTVRARITGDHQASQKFILRLIDPSDALCVEDVLMEDQTLNSVASSVFVDVPSGLISFVDSGQQGAMMGVLWRVKILVANT
jgi:hypothetical protein